MADKIRGIIIELGADIKQFSKGMKQASQETDSVGEKLKNIAVDVTKAMAVAGTAAATAAAALGKAVVSTYADYEQLVGGIETLFGNSSVLIDKYAEDAYKTAGISANEYMETVTGFSASLISSLNGDTQTAAVYANQAIQDMSDNANKMGSDMESIQNAYSGFAKQNYTMLDNLKLGYGGTKEEMERLISDANALKEANGEMGDLTIESYADIITAIHMVQTEIGITGTTAKEAESTITGSINMTKAAWDNLLITMGTGEGVEEAVNKLIDSALNVVENITPVVERMIGVLPDILEALIPSIIELTPTLTETFVQLVGVALEGLLQSLPVFIKTIDTLANTLYDSFKSTIIGRFPEAERTFSEVESTVTGWAEDIQEIVQAFLEVVQEFWNQYGDEIMAFIGVVMDTIKVVIDSALTAIKAIIDIFAALLKGDWKALWEGIMTLVDSVFRGIDAVINAYLTAIATAIDIALKIIQNLWSNIWNSIKTTVLGIVDTIKEKILSIVDVAKNWGKDLIQNFIDGIKEKWEDLKSMVSDVADSVKDFLGFSEPKKGPLSNFHTYAPDMMKLYAEGIKDNSYLITDQINNLASQMSGSVRSTANITLTTPVYLDGRVISSVVNQQLGVLL